MKHASFKQTQTFKNSDQCTAYEYPIKDPDINAVMITVNGRYPNQGYAVNRKCKEMAYIIKGTGKLVVKGKPPINLQPKDIVLLIPGEIYYWEGNFDMFVPSTPAWHPKQHQIFEQ